MNCFKERLKELRLEKQLKQSQIAKELRIPEGTYSNWEQGRTQPDIDGLITLANFFKVTVDYLIGKEN